MKLCKAKYCCLITMLLVGEAACGSTALAGSPQESTAEIVRDIVDRSLPAIRQGGQQWITDNDCLSCHRVSFQVWALNRADELGLKSDREQLKEWNTWATDWKNMVKPHLREKTSMGTALTSESDTMAQLLLGRPRVRKGLPEPEWVAVYRNHLLKTQREDGSWEPVGQLPKQKRSLRETTEVTTMWTQLALLDAGTPKAELARATKRARKWMGAATRGKSAEWWATKLMFERKFGEKTAADALRSRLLAQQQDDGGWGWLIKENSDALGTGIVLYALARDGLALEHHSVGKAVAFLRKSQQPDGSWEVRGTKEGDRDTVVETSSYWGTTWSVIGLLEFSRNGDTSRRVTKVDRNRQVSETQFVSAQRSTQDGTGEPVPPADTQFENQIRPLLVKYCAECHKPGNMPGLDFLAAKTKAEFDPLRHVYINVVRALENRTMPPRDLDQPSDAERVLLTSWLRKTLKETTPDGEPVIPDATRQISKYVVGIYEDRKGNLWFGTMQRGAVRYDGRSLTYLTKKDGLPGGGVTSFAEDKDENLWIGTQEGICRYDGKAITRFGEADGLFPVKEKNTPFPPGGGNVYADKDRNIWANMYSGIFRFNGRSFFRYQLPIKKSETASYGLIPGKASLTLEDSHGNLWFTTDGYGALKFDGKSFTRFTKKDGLCSNNVNRILEDKQGNIWFACMQSHQPRQTGDGGICRLDGKTFTKFPSVKGLHDNDIYTMYQDRAGNIWIGATGHGVYRYDGKHFKLFEKTDRMDLTWSLGLQAAYEARNGTLWLGFSGGLFRFNGTSIINVDKDGPWESVAMALSKGVDPDEAQSKWLHATTRTALSDLAKGNVEKAELALQQLKRDEPEEITIQDHTLNQLGYELMHTKRMKLAIEVFKINTRLYPQISNTFDSLGGAYLRQGKEKLAIANYKRSLELDPRNTEAGRTIRQIVGRQKYEKRLVAPKGWMEEVIALPPSFAPGMSFRGLEHLRLPPDFRKPKSDWFMSYLFALDLSERADLTEESIGAQLLIYFRGLASGGRDKAGNEIDTTKFSIVSQKHNGTQDGEYIYALNWREPFVNGTPLKQNLRVKVVSEMNNHGVVFVCGSPKQFASPVWTELLKIRTAFEAAAIGPKAKAPSNDR